MHGFLSRGLNSDSMTGREERDSARGWLLVAIGTTMLVLVWGLIFTFTVYAGELAAAFELSRLRVSSLFSIATAGFFLAGGVAGVGIARTPLRPVVAAAGVTLAAGVGLLQVVTSYVGLAVAFALVGTAGGTVFLVTISLVPQWFDAYEGRAMGVTLTGNGIGILVLPPAWVWLFDRTAIQGAFAVIGGAAALSILVASLVYRRPAGLDRPGTLGVGLDWVRSRLSDRPFLVALVGYPLLWSWYFVLSAGLVDILTTAGIAETLAATAFGIIGGISVLTRLASGVAADRVGMRPTLLVGVVLAALGVLALLVTDTPVLMYGTLVVFGVGLGAVATLFSPILIDRFGPEDATAIIGLVTIAEAASAFGAPLAMVVLVDLTGGYALPLVLLALVTLAGVGMFHWGTRPAPAG